MKISFSELMVKALPHETLPKGRVWFSYEGSEFCMNRVVGEGIRYGDRDYLLSVGYVVTKVSFLRRVRGSQCVVTIEGEREYHE